MAGDSAVPIPAVDLGAYAEILGRTWLQGEESLHRELTARNVSTGAWEDARTHWTSAIDASVARGETELVVGFAARFEAARSALPAEVAPPPDASPAQPSDAPLVEPVAPSVVGPPPVVVPSYLAAPVLMSESAPAIRPLLVAAPAVAPAVAPVAAPIVHPPLVRPTLAGTAVASGGPSGPATPFTPASASALDGLREYAALTAEIALDPQRAADVLARHQLTPAAKQALDAEWQTKLARNAMASLQFPRLVEKESARLKEQRGATPAPPSSAPRSSSNIDETAPPPMPGSYPREALPFAVEAKTQTARGAELTLPRYASLCVELAMAPERKGEVLHRYGMSGDADLAEVERIWGDRLAQNPVQAAEFHAAVQSYRAWLRGR